MPRLPRTLAVVLACLLMALAAGCGEDDPAEVVAPEDTGGEQQTGCAPAEQPPAKDVQLRRPRERLTAGTTYVATVATNCGEFEITLAARRAPRTGGSFKYLADQGFYDDTTFHRVATSQGSSFVIQGGDPLGNGMGGPGFSVVEAPPADLRYVRGVVAMAKTDIEAAGTSGSQFFVVTAEDAGLPPAYALVGEVTGGMEVVDRIAAVPVDASDRPVAPVVIESIGVAES